MGIVSYSYTLYYKAYNKILQHKYTRKYYGITKNNVKLKNRCKGKKCYILGNGPSVLSQDLGFLKDENVFVVNSIWRNKKLLDIVNPDYYLLMDPVFFDKSMQDIVEEDLNGIKDFLMSQKVPPIIFLPVNAKEIVERQYNWDKYTDIYYINILGSFDDERIGDDYNITKCVFGFQSVIIYAIAIATYLGYEEINLLGVEQSDIIHYLNSFFYNDLYIPSYSYKLNENQIRNARILNTHASFVTTMKGYAEIFAQYERAYKYCIKRGISLYNCTPKSLIQGIPHKDLLVNNNYRKGY